MSLLTWLLVLQITLFISLSLTLVFWVVPFLTYARVQIMIGMKADGRAFYSYTIAFIPVWVQTFVLAAVVLVALFLLTAKDSRVYHEARTAVV